MYLQLVTQYTCNIVAVCWLSLSVVALDMHWKWPGAKPRTPFRMSAYVIYFSARAWEFLFSRHLKQPVL